MLFTEQKNILNIMRDPQQVPLPIGPVFSHKTKQDKNELGPRIKRTSSHASLWREIKSTSEEINGRYHHASVLCDGVLYVYGGYDNDVGVLADFKMFDCTQEKGQWRTLSTEHGPGPRHSHSAVFHDGSIYVFGGKVDRFKSTDLLHVYSIGDKKWKQLQDHSEQSQRVEEQKIRREFKSRKQKVKEPVKVKPGPIDSHQAVMIKQEMIVYGGFSNNQFSSEIFSFNVTKNEWRKIYPGMGHEEKDHEGNQQPQPRSDFSMVAYREKIYIYGGKNLYGNFSDLWEFDLALGRFREIKTDFIAEKRSGHSAVVFDDKMVVFGGITSVTHERDDLLCFSFNDEKWGTIWNNCEDKISKQRTSKKQSANSKVNLLQNTTLKSKYEQRSIERPQKYRRPLAEEKISSMNQNRLGLRQKEKNKKKKQRKYLLINEIETPSPNYYAHSSPEKFSPLIQSLTNSIMLTSNLNHSSTISTSREKGQKLLLAKYQEMDQDQAKFKERKLKARDGHTAHIMGDAMIVFGGDRHMFAINDIVQINLDSLLLASSIQEKTTPGKVLFEEKVSPPR